MNEKTLKKIDDLERSRLVNVNIIAKNFELIKYTTKYRYEAINFF